MVYTPQTWVNGAGGLTPISAERLGYMENGIVAADVEAVKLAGAQTLTDAPKTFFANSNGDSLLEFDTNGTALRYPIEFRSEAAYADPYKRRAYFGGTGSFHTMAWIVVSAKKTNLAGDIQGVSALSDGTEPSMLSVSPDVNGPALAIEAASNLTGGQSNSAALAVYDVNDIHGGVTSWSAGYGRKKFQIDGRGGHWWGADLVNAPATNYDVKLERTAASTLKLTGKTDLIHHLDALTGAIDFSFKRGGVSVLQFYVGNNVEAALSVAGVTCMRLNNDTGVIIGGAATAGMVLGVKSTNAALPVITALQATAGQTADLLRVANIDATTIFSRFDKAGYFMTRKTAAPADADLANSEGAIWWDPTPGTGGFRYKGKDSAGAVLSGSL